MKEGLIILDKVISGEVISGKKGAQENGVILDEKEFGIGIAANTMAWPWYPPKEPITPCCCSGGSSAMGAEEDIIL